MTLSQFQEQLSKIRQSLPDHNEDEIIEFLRIKKYLRRLQRSRVMAKLTAMWVFQCVLVALLFNYFRRLGFYDPYSYSILIVSFVCCLALHLYLQPGVFKSIERMRYLFSHKHHFEQTFLPFCICLMRFIVEIGVELTEIFTTFNLNDELWMVMCYAALTCIGTIDHQYYDIIDDKIKDKLVEKYQYCLKIENEADFEKTDFSMLGSNSPLTKREKAYYLFTMFLEFFYQTIYFYFFPYLAIIYEVFVLLKYNEE